VHECVIGPPLCTMARSKKHRPPPPASFRWLDGSASLGLRASSSTSFANTSSRLARRSGGAVASPTRRLRLPRSALWHRLNGDRKSENRESSPVAEFSSKRF